MWTLPVLNERVAYGHFDDESSSNDSISSEISDSSSIASANHCPHDEDELRHLQQTANNIIEKSWREVERMRKQSLSYAETASRLEIELQESKKKENEAQLRVAKLEKEVRQLKEFQKSFPLFDRLLVGKRSGKESQRKLMHMASMPHSSLNFFDVPHLPLHM